MVKSEMATCSSQSDPSQRWWSSTTRNSCKVNPDAPHDRLYGPVWPATPEAGETTPSQQYSGSLAGLCRALSGREFPAGLGNLCRSKMEQDKAVTSPQPTPARSADQKWRFDAVCETLVFENGGGQIWHHGVHAGVRCDITVSSDAGLKPFLRGSRVASTGFLPILSRFRK